MPKDPTGRALQLLSLLQTHRLWRGAELAERLEATERTVRRYVAWAQTGHFGPNSRQTDRTVTAHIRHYGWPSASVVSNGRYGFMPPTISD